MPRLTFNPALTLTGFRTTRPRCNDGEMGGDRARWIEEGIPRLVFFWDLMQITTATQRERHQTKGLLDRKLAVHVSYKSLLVCFCPPLQNNNV